MNQQFADSIETMRRAVELAARGIGLVEPNPPVGAVIVDDEMRLLGEGCHERFGGPHAEVNALALAGERAAGATMFVTLEPCRHSGKTPPCTAALIQAGIRRLFVAMRDPSPHADGGGIEELRQAGVEVQVGLLEAEALRVAAPFVKRVTTGLPWVHAKWAMTLDGRIAARTGDSRWISNEASRDVVHKLRGRMDAIVIGRKTAETDDPSLTARPPGPRTAVRVVFDSRGLLPLHSQLARTAAEVPLLVAAHQSAPAENVDRLRSAGVEVLTLPSGTDAERDPADASQTEATELIKRPHPLLLLKELGRREMTNVLVEGGGRLFGSFFEGRLIDECHVFVAPKIVGGAEASGPIEGDGVSRMAEALRLIEPKIEILEGDVYVHGRLEDRATR